MESSHTNVVYLPAFRPWFTLYNVRLKVGRSDEEVPLAPIQLLLPVELLHHVFLRLPVMDVARAQCVCRQWKELGSHPALWKQACLQTFADSSPQETAKLVQTQYRGAKQTCTAVENGSRVAFVISSNERSSWRTMLLDRSHLRFDGVYVSRNMYLRTGVVEWEVKNAVHTVLFFRYMRFYPDGTFAYRTSPELPNKVCKLFQNLHTRHARRLDHVFFGRWKLVGNTVYTSLQYQDNARTEMRCKLGLRSTVRGANNILDIRQIVTYDREDGSVTPFPAGPGDQDPAEALEGRESKRGLTAYRLVTWDKITTTEMNLPVSQLDFYLPG